MVDKFAYCSGGFWSPRSVTAIGLFLAARVDRFVDRVAR